MLADKPTELSRIKLKNLNSTARPYDQGAFSPLDPTVSWLSHLALAIYIFVVVNFDALAQASDIQIERRQVVFLCWMQDLNPGPRHQIASRLNARWQTDWAIEDQAKKTWTRQPVPMISEHSAHLTPLSVDFRTLLWRHTYLLLLISMLWHRQAIFESKGDKLCSSAESRIWTRDPRHQISCRLNAPWQTDWAIEDQAKKLELDSPSLWSASIQPTWPHCQLTFAPGSGDIHICCCSFRCSGTGKRYSNRKETSCVPLLKAGFEPGIPDTKSPADWMLADKPTELSRIKLEKTWTRQPN